MSKRQDKIDEIKVQQSSKREQRVKKLRRKLRRKRTRKLPLENRITMKENRDPKRLSFDGK